MKFFANRFGREAARGIYVMQMRAEDKMQRANALFGGERTPDLSLSERVR